MVVMLDQPPSAAAPVISNPAWAERPTARDMAGVYPARAARSGLSGAGTIRCGVRTNGSLMNCAVVSESPADEGFGAAALALAPRFRMRPRTVNGRPATGGTVTIPMRFNVGVGRGQPIDEVDAVPLIAQPRWREAPSRAEAIAAAPETAGLVLLRCRATAEGRLRACQAVSETPARQGLEAAARRLIPAFRLVPLETGSLEGVRVDVPFVLSRTPGDYLDNPSFLQAATAEELDAALLALAVGQPDREAGARLDCRVGRAGALEDCRTTRASPEAAGPAALGLASRFQVAPWTTDGRATAGARLRISLRYRDEQPGTTAR